MMDPHASFVTFYFNIKFKPRLGDGTTEFNWHKFRPMIGPFREIYLSFSVMSYVYYLFITGLKERVSFTLQTLMAQ